MIRVDNRRPGAITIDATFTFEHGINEVPEDVYREIQGSEFFQWYIHKKWFVVLDKAPEPAPSSEPRPPPGNPVSTPNSTSSTSEGASLSPADDEDKERDKEEDSFTLKLYTLAEARPIVAKETDLKQLRIWHKKAKRKGLKEAIERRMGDLQSGGS